MIDWTWYKIPNPLSKALEQINKRCNKANIQHKWIEDISGHFILQVLIPKGSSYQAIEIMNNQDADYLVASEFELYQFVEGFESAICSYSLNSIEAVIDSTDNNEVPRAFTLSRLIGKNYEIIEKDLKEGKGVRIVLKGGKNKTVKISIGKPSNNLLGMVNYYDTNDVLSILIEGLDIHSNDESADQLKQITNSLFYEIEKKRFDLHLFINREHDVTINDWGIMKWQRGKRGISSISFPKFQYDNEPMELYWHAEGASQMPLLQYLAYYQILEWYYPKYSMLRAKSEVSNIIKDPEFDADDDNDIINIINGVSSKLGRNVDEMSQLLDTIRECVSESDLDKELQIEPMKEYFKKEYKSVSNYRISQEDISNDMRTQLANRIYDIRCKIVHSKVGNKRGKIMPFSLEETLLQKFDLPLMKFVTNMVLVANRKHLEL